MRSACVLLGLAAALPACVDAQERGTTDPDPAVGCYRIDLGPWAPELDPGIARRQVPARFRLDAATDEDRLGPGRRIVWPVIPSRSPRAWWRRTSKDSVRIVWTSGYVGALLQVRVAGDSLSGTARAFTDQIGLPEPEAEVRGRRTDCAEVSRQRHDPPSGPARRPAAGAHHSATR